jgi:hypothetical protein
MGVTQPVNGHNRYLCFDAMTVIQAKKDIIIANIRDFREMLCRQ